MKKSEIEEIIKRREILVENATSEAQREIYQGYLEFWQEKLGVKPEPELVDTAEVDEIITPIVAEIEKPEEVYLDHLEEALTPLLEDDSTIIHEELRKSYEELFKLEYPNKQAYYNRDGQKLKTKAFIEFLNKNK